MGIRGEQLRDGVSAAGEDRQRLKLFINYRHADTGWAAWALYFKLEEEFGSENIFFDNGTLKPGMEWFEEIQAHVDEAGVFLGLIGPDWMKILSASSISVERRRCASREGPSPVTSARGSGGRLRVARSGSAQTTLLPVYRVVLGRWRAS